MTADSTSEIHKAAAEGFQKEAVRYHRGRPDYPPGVMDWLTDSLSLAPGATVVDLGAGTGRFTKWLVKTGAGVTAVEPVAAMREQLQTTLPSVAALAGNAEAIPMPDESVDAIVCAQSFHWFSTPAALAEIHRVLKPGGKLGLIWNVRDEDMPWVAALTGLMVPFEGDAPRYASGEWRKLFPAPGFGPLETVLHPYEHRGSAEQVIIDRTLSVSFIAALPEEAKEELARTIRNLIAETPELAGKDDISYPYQTRCHSCVKEG